MAGKKVKGSLLLDYVRMIRANRDKEWERYLSGEDWEIINSRIIPAAWYPFETFVRAGMAVFYELAGGDLSISRAWGKTSMENLIKNIYKSVICDKDPMKALERFILLRRQFFNFSEQEFERVSDKHARIFFDYGPDRYGGDPYAAQFEGGVETIVEIACGFTPKIISSVKKQNGSNDIVFDITWA